MHQDEGTDEPRGAITGAVALSELPVAELLASVADPFFTLDQGWCFSFVNAAAERFLGRPGSELLGASIWTLCPWLGGTPFEHAYRAAMATGEPQTATMWVADLEGWFCVQAVPHRAGLSVLFHDVSAIKAEERATAQLAATRDLLRSVATAVADGAASGAVHQLVCQETAGLVGALGCWSVRFTDAGAEVVGAAAPADAGLFGVGDAVAPAPDGLLEAVRGSRAPVTGVQGGWELAAAAAVPVVLDGRLWGALVLGWAEAEVETAPALELLTDLAALIASALGHYEARAAIEHQAATDALTGLANLRTCHRRLDEAISRAQRHEHPLTLALVDVDHFKEVNDGFGHAAGDRLLRLVAAELQAVGRAEDLAARVGGDEFALVLDGSDAAAAYSVAERLRERIAGLAERDIPPVTASIGLCDWRPGIDRDELLRRADDALSWAKVHGRDAAHVHDPATMDVSRAAQREAVLRRRLGVVPDVLDGPGHVEQARAFWRATLDALPEHVAVLDQQGAIVATNEAWARFGLEHDCAIARPRAGEDYLGALRGSPAPADARLAAELAEVLDGSREGLELEYPLPGPRGARWFVVRAYPFEAGDPRRVLVHHEESTERKLARDRLVLEAQLLHRVPAAVVATDSDGRITQWNDGAERLYGYSRAEALGAVLETLLPEEDTSTRQSLPGEARGAGGWEGEVQLRGRDGLPRPVHVQAATFTGEDGGPSGTVAVSVDLAERYARQRDAEAARDYLLAVTSSIADGLLTCDGSGLVTYANAAAAELLRHPEGGLVGRGLREAVYRDRAPGTDTPPIDPRAGTTRVDDDVFLCADGSPLAVTWTSTALPDAGRGPGRVVTFADNTARKVRETQLRHETEALRWAARIRTALDDDQFVLLAQPIVTSDSGAVEGHELLIRLRDGEGGYVLPADFLPAAEEHELMAEIDAWVLGRALEIAGSGMPVHVNISAQSIGDPAITDLLRRTLERTRTDPALVTVEFTESALITNLGAANEFAGALRKLGCSLSLDDFGTGYNSFARVTQIPVDELKIDMQFVRELLTHAASESVVKAIVSLADDLDVRTVAEGVEDAETAERLRALGVTFLQGYLFGRPEPLEDSPDATPSALPAGTIMPGLDILERARGTTMVLSLRGELDVHSVRSLRTAVIAATGLPGGVVLDLHELAFLDSTGLALLLQLPRTAAEEGWTVSYRRPSRAVQSVLAVAGIADLLPWHEELRPRGAPAP